MDYCSVLSLTSPFLFSTVKSWKSQYKKEVKLVLWDVKVKRYPEHLIHRLVLRFTVIKVLILKDHIFHSPFYLFLLVYVLNRTFVSINLKGHLMYSCNSFLLFNLCRPNPELIDHFIPLFRTVPYTVV